MVVLLAIQVLVETYSFQKVETEFLNVTHQPRKFFLTNYLYKDYPSPFKKKM